MVSISHATSGKRSFSRLPECNHNGGPTILGIPFNIFSLPHGQLALSRSNDDTLGRSFHFKVTRAAGPVGVKIEPAASPLAREARRASNFLWTFFVIGLPCPALVARDVKDQ